jgi:hypothetical protein
LKIAPILAQYLYQHKRLDLPGIGSFLLDNSALSIADNPRQQKPAVLEGVSFEPNSSIKEQADLIQFISTNTGKIKALASADLDSHLELAKQFLNIGKPFLFEGIGTLSRIKGEYSFTAGHTIYEPVKEIQSRVASSTYEEQPTDYKDVLFHKKKEMAWKKPLTFLLIAAGLGLAVWGGYKVYKSSSAKETATTDTAGVNSNPPFTANPADTTKTNTGTATQNNDVNAPPAPTVITSAPLPTGAWKFVVETAARERALKRFAKLQAIGVKTVQMETKDSATFKIYFAIPASVADTARMIDSLRRNYTPAGARAYVEQ